MKTLLEIAGVLLIGLGLLHGVFPRYFRWREETADLTPLTRQILHIHTFFIGLTVFLMGLLCLTSATDLIQTPLGRRICLGLGLFWGIRLMLQFFGYSSRLWRGKPFETAMHVLFSLFWAFLTALFLGVVIRNPNPLGRAKHSGAPLLPLCEPPNGSPLAAGPKTNSLSIGHGDSNKAGSAGSGDELLSHGIIRKSA